MNIIQAFKNLFNSKKNKKQIRSGDSNERVAAKTNSAYADELARRVFTQQQKREKQEAEVRQKERDVTNRISNVHKATSLGARRDARVAAEAKSSKERAEKIMPTVKKAVVAGTERDKQALYKANHKTLDKRTQELKAKKIGSVEQTAKDILAANEAHPLMSQFTRKAGKGAALGLDPEKLIDKYGNNKIKAAINTVDKNLTEGQKKAGTAGEIAGNVLAYAMTGGIGEAAGKAVSKEGTKVGDTLSKLSNSKFVKNIAAKQGVNAEKLSAQVLKGLQTDLGINLTTGNVQAIVDAIDTAKEKDGDTGDKVWSGVKSYIGNQALNMALGAGIELAPAAKAEAKKAAQRAMVKLSDKRGAVTLTNGAAKEGERAVKKQLKPKTFKQTTGPDVTVGNGMAIRNDTGDVIADARDNIDLNFRANEQAPAPDVMPEVKEEIRKPQLKQAKADKKISSSVNSFSKGYAVDKKQAKKSMSDAVSEVKTHIANGDNDYAIKAAQDRAGEIVKGMSNELPLEEYYQAIKNDIRSTTLGVPRHGKADVGRGDFNFFRKKHMGSLNITKDGVPIDKAWQAWQEAYGPEMFPDIPAEDMFDRLAEIVNVKGRNVPLAADEEQYLKEKIANELWELANDGNEHLPMNEAYEQAMAPRGEFVDDAAEAELRSEADQKDFEEWLARENQQAAGQTPNDGRPLPDAEDLAEQRAASQQGMVDESIPGIEPEMEPKEAMPGEGVRNARSAFGDTEFEARTADEMSEARNIYNQNYGYGATGKRGTATSQSAESILGMTGSEVEADVVKGMRESGALDYRIITHEESNRAIKEVMMDPEKANAEMREIMNDNYQFSLKGEKYNSIRRTHARSLALVQYNGTMLKKAKAAENADPVLIKQLEDDLFNSVVVAKDLSSQSGGVLEMQRYYKLLSPEGRAELAKRDAINLLEKSRGFRSENKNVLVKGKDKAAQEMRKTQITEILDNDEGFTTALDNLRNGSAEDAADNYTEVMNQLNKLQPMHVIDYLQEWRYLSMLGNPKTHIRNIIGNTLFGGVRDVSNAISSGFEQSLKGKQIRKVENVVNSIENGKITIEGETFIANVFNYRKATMQDVANAGDKANFKVGDLIDVNGQKVSDKKLQTRLAQYKEDLEFVRKGGLDLTAKAKSLSKDPNAADMKAWKEVEQQLLGEENKMNVRDTSGKKRLGITKIVGGLSEANRKALEWEDRTALSQRFRETFIKLSKANKLSKLDPGSEAYTNLYDKIITEATQEALESTFREKNEMANVLTNLTDPLYDANASLGKRAIAWGVNTLVPFAKTPANILRQTFRFSPAGLAESAYQYRKAIATGDIDALNRAIDRFGSGATGTAILAIGIWLGGDENGLITTNAGSDAGSKFEKNQGIQNYAVRIGDKTYTLDWLSPLATTFFTGAEVRKQMEKNGFGGLLNPENIGTIASRIAEPLLETSMLSGIQDTFEKMTSNYGDQEVNPISRGVAALGQNYVMSMIPTLVGQVSRASYESDMALDTSSNTAYFISQVKNKTGLANTDLFGQDALGQATDAYGNVKNPRSVGKTIATFLSPANIQNVNLTKEDEELVKAYREAIKNGMDPDTAKSMLPTVNYNRTFKVGKGKDKTVIQMNNKQNAEYNKAKATEQGGKDAMEALLSSRVFNYYGSGKELSAEEKKKLIAEAPKSTQEVVQWFVRSDYYKNASDDDRQNALQKIFRAQTSTGAKIGNTRTSQRAAWAAAGNDPIDYDFQNELTLKQQQAYEQYKDVISKEELLEAARLGNGKKQYQYEDGKVQGRTTKTQLLEFLSGTDLSESKRAAIFNILKSSTTKPYGSSGGRGRGGYRHYGHRGGSKSVGTNKSAPKMAKLKKATALGGKTATASAKASMPQLKRVEAKVELPKAKW